MNNKLSDLNNHLFAELERLGDESIIGDELVDEVSRAKAIAGISSQIINNATIQLDAMKLKCEYGKDNVNLSNLIGENK